MKLQEICPKKGTYVGLRVLNPANEQLYLHCKSAGIEVKKSMFDKRLHTQHLSTVENFALILKLILKTINISVNLLAMIFLEKAKKKF